MPLTAAFSLATVCLWKKKILRLAFVPASSAANFQPQLKRRARLAAPVIFIALSVSAGTALYAGRSAYPQPFGCGIRMTPLEGAFCSLEPFHFEIALTVVRRAARRQ